MLPTGYLVYHALTVPSYWSAYELGHITKTTVLLSFWTTLIVVFFSFLLVCGKRFIPTRLVRSSFFLTTFGYCIPGVVLGVAFLAPLSFLNEGIEHILHWLSPDKARTFLLFGTPAILIYAYSVRFFAPAVHTLEAGLTRISPRIDDAARTLKRSTKDIMFKLYGPMLGPSWIAAAFLVYLDCMKELPITLLLRGPNTETLATRLYTEVIGNSYETSAMSALILILCGLSSVGITMRLQSQRPAWL
jgi:iron(III) transport system permease protein